MKYIVNAIFQKVVTLGLFSPIVGLNVTIMYCASK